MIYKVEILETLSKVIEVDAESEDEAISKIRKDYKDEKVVLDAEDYLGTEFSIFYS